MEIIDLTENIKRPETASDTEIVTTVNVSKLLHKPFTLHSKSRLAKRREILIFPRRAGKTGNSRELPVIPGNYWEISSSPTRKFKYFLQPYNYICCAKLVITDKPFIE